MSVIHAWMKRKEQLTFPLRLVFSLFTGGFELVWIIGLREKDERLLPVKC